MGSCSWSILSCVHVYCLVFMFILQVMQAVCSVDTRSFYVRVIWSASAGKGQNFRCRKKVRHKTYILTLQHIRVQELCESRGGRPGLSVLTSLAVSVDVKQHWTVLRHWSQFVPNMSTDLQGHEALLHQHLQHDAGRTYLAKTVGMRTAKKNTPLVFVFNVFFSRRAYKA